MRKGFIFTYDLCVACNSCAAACRLENSDKMPLRRIYAGFPLIYPGLPAHNISMACNHCQDPVCLKSCPAGAYSVHLDTGAITLNDKLCIGCNYCFWNCPFDAPVYNDKRRKIEKCDFCIGRQEEGIEPACSSACPTGALRFDLLNNANEPEDETFRIEKNTAFSSLDPSLETIIPAITQAHPVIIPEPAPIDNYKPVLRSGSKIKAVSEWSLILFSVLSSHLFALNFSSWNSGVSLSSNLYLSLVLITGLVSLLHLGKPLKSFLALRNIKSSPLSMEIAGFCMFSLSSVAAWIFAENWIWIISFISGLVFLYLIDSVYTFVDKRVLIRIHPGQVFAAGLMIASYYSSELLAFGFIALLRIILISFHIREKINNKWLTRALIIYIFIIVSAVIHLIIMSEPELLFIILVALSELGIRTIYYIDLSPVSIGKLLYQKK